MTNIEMADNKATEAGMENNVAETAESFEAERGAERAKGQERTGTEASVDVAYILAQVKAIQDNTAYLSEAISALAGTYGSDDGDNGGNTAEVRAEALGNIVRYRETTNQQLLDFYRTVYIDLKSQS